MNSENCPSFEIQGPMPPDVCVNREEGYWVIGQEPQICWICDGIGFLSGGAWEPPYPCDHCYGYGLIELGPDPEDECWTLSPQSIALPDDINQGSSMIDFDPDLD